MRLHHAAACCAAFCFLLAPPPGLPGRLPTGRETVWDRRGGPPSAPPLSAGQFPGRSENDERDYFHWPRLPVRVFVAATTGQEREWARVSEAGFDQWVQATRGVVAYTLVDLPSQAQIVVRFAPGPTVWEHPDLVGMTTTNWTGPVLESAQVVLAAGRKTPADLQAVAAHEFGHALGIRGHSGNPGDVMFASLRECPASAARPLPPPAHPVTAHDLDDLRRCYPALLTPGSGG